MKPLVVGYQVGRAWLSDRFWCPRLLGSDHFLLRHRHCVKERLHRRLAEAPAPLMWPRLVVFADPHIKIGLELVNGTVHLFAERDAIKLMEHGLVEALAGLFVLVRE